MKVPQDHDKAQFIEQIKGRTKQFAIDSIHFCNSLRTNQTTQIISRQLIRSATSTGANYRAACRARSKAEFYAKISIVVEEIDESLYWLELIRDLSIQHDGELLHRLIEESTEILKMAVTARKNTTR
jgi:four helix bundle protein